MQSYRFTSDQREDLKMHLLFAPCLDEKRKERRKVLSNLLFLQSCNPTVSSLPSPGYFERSGVALEILGLQSFRLDTICDVPPFAVPSGQ